MLQALHDEIRFLLRKDRTGFIPTEDITSAINTSSYDLWRELIRKYKETGVPSDLLIPFKDHADLTLSGGATTLSSQAEAHISGVSITVDGGSYPTTLLHSDADWAVRRSIDRPNKDFLQKRFAFNTLTNQVADLPDDFKSAGQVVYYVDADGITAEGEILDYDEFYNRKNSVILTPDIENPIATIYDNSIEFAPDFDNASDEYEFIYFAYADKRNTFSRYEPSFSAMSIEVDLATTESIEVFYYSFPVTASHGTPTYTARVADDLTSVVEMGWDNEAFGELVTRAMGYLGVPIKDPQAIQLEQQKNVNEIQSPN